MRRHSTLFTRAALGLVVGLGLSGGNASAGGHHRQVYVVQPTGGLGVGAPAQTVGVLGVAPSHGLFHHRQQVILVGAPAQMGGQNFGITPSFGMAITNTPSFGLGVTTTPSFGLSVTNTPSFGLGVTTTPSFGLGMGGGLSTSGLGSPVLGAGNSLTTAERDVANLLGGTPQAVAATQRIKAHIGSLVDQQQQGLLGAGLDGSALVRGLIQEAIAFASREFAGIDLSPIFTNVERLVRDVIQERAVDKKKADLPVGPVPNGGDNTTTNGKRSIPVQARGYLVIEQIYFNGQAVTPEKPDEVTPPEEPAVGPGALDGDEAPISNPLGARRRRATGSGR